MIPPSPLHLFNDATWELQIALQHTPELAPHVSKVPGSWAGDRIILLGDHSDDLPPGVLTNGDLLRIKERQREYVTEIEAEREYAQDEQAFRDAIEEERLFGDMDYDLDSEEEDSIGPEDDLLPAYLLRRCSREPMRVTYHPRCAEGPDVWVLRNLTKREFVRSDGIPTRGTIQRNEVFVPELADMNRHGGYKGIPGLGQALLLRIGWSSDSQYMLPFKVEVLFHRGAWAGDRFDLRVYDDVAECMLADGWADVTVDVAHEIFRIWKLGEEWDSDEAEI